MSSINVHAVNREVNMQIISSGIGSSARIPNTGTLVITRIPALNGYVGCNSQSAAVRGSGTIGAA